jgi:LPS export ABC transporter protein LptC
MMGKGKIFYLIVFLSAIMFNGCENDLNKVKLYGKAEKTPVETAKNIKIFYSDSAFVKVEMTAPVLDHYTSGNPYVEMPSGLRAIFYDNRLNVTSRMSAGYGIRYERDQKMEARKNVIVVNEKGEQLNTEHLIWDERRQKLLSDEFVTITTKDEILYGTGFESNEDFTKYKIFKPTGTFSINKNSHDKNS